MTGLLLDTHALIWWWLEDPKLSGAARDAIQAADNHVVVSSVSTYEIANKGRTGRLPALSEMLLDLDEALIASGFVQLPLTSRHAVRAGFLVGDHRNPFDRMIAAQGMLERLVVVTRDREIAAFGCEVLW